MVIARVEALIAGWGQEEALKRAHAYVEAGADAAARVGELVCTNIIPSAHEEVFEQMGQKK